MHRNKAVSSNQADRSVASREFLTAGCLHFVQGGTIPAEVPAERALGGSGCGLAFRAHQSHFKGLRMEVDVFVNGLLRSLSKAQIINFKLCYFRVDERCGFYHASF